MQFRALKISIYFHFGLLFRHIYNMGENLSHRVRFFNVYLPIARFWLISQNARFEFFAPLLAANMLSNASKLLIFLQNAFFRPTYSFFSKKCSNVDQKSIELGYSSKFVV